jgi:CHAT domain-containing protein/Flp pilus assembly protein TadD
MKKLVVVLLAVFAAVPLGAQDAEFYFERGREHLRAGNIDAAIADNNKAIALNPQHDRAYNNRGIAYYNKGELDRAIADYTQAIALNPKNDVAYNNRGIAYVAKGELDRAIADYTHVIALNPNNDFAYTFRGNVYLAKGEPDRAIANYPQAIALNPKLWQAYINRGLAYAANGDPDRAIADYTQAIALNPNYAMAYNNRGVAYKDKGELDRAIADYTQAIALNPKDDAPYNNRGNAYLAKGEPDRAIADYTQAALAADGSANILDIFHRSWEFAGFLYKTYPFLGTVLDANAYRRQYANVARDALTLSIAKAEKARAELGSRGATLMASMVYQYYAALDFEARFGSSERTFAVSECLRSRGFLEQMGTEAALRLPGIAPADARRVRELTETIGNLQELLGKLNPQTQEERYAEAGIALTRVEEELVALDRRITEKVPRYADLRNPKTAALGEAQALCGEDTTILEFALWDASVEFTPPSTSSSQSSYKDRPSINSYCLVITKDGITPVRLDPNFDYAAAVNELRSLLIKRAPVSEMESVRNNLYAALIKPAIPYIPRQIKNLMIVPDGTLGHLPFDILRENDSSPDLGLAYRISFSPSVSVSVLAAQTGVDRLEPLFALGGAWYNRNKAAADRGNLRDIAILDESNDANNPSDAGTKERRWMDLPGTEMEIQNLRRMVSSPNQILALFGNEVSEQRIKRMSANGELNKYPIIHFACHGYFNEADAARSGIVLSGVSGLLENEEDGYLTIPEIAVLDMKSRMVMLSACETGLAALKRGDGMVGMARAFMVAGTENVGVSLWSISDDGTSEFMSRLYGKVIKEGLSFREAYYQVKQEFRRDAKWSHPYYWAAFTMYE